jgi:hypothetical protein
LTAYLNPEPQANPSYIAARDRTITANVDRFSGAFRPWQNNELDAARHNLSSLMRKAAGVAILLFSQPASFECYWEPRRRRGVAEPERVLAVVPDHVKSGDENGQALDRVRILVDMVTERI